MRSNAGSEGIAKARAERPDAIVAGHLDGPATLLRLQTDPQTREIPILVLTATTHSARRRADARPGVAGALTQPFDPLTLTDHITAILTGSDHTP